MQLTGFVVAQDVATGACGIVNAGYFGGYWLNAEGRGRRMSAAVLGGLGVATLAEAIK